MLKPASMLVNVGTQAGVFDSRLLIGFMIDLVEKCQSVQRDFARCMDDLQRGRNQMDQAEEVMGKMNRAFGAFSESLDNLSGRALQERASNSQRIAHVEKLRRDIAFREDRLAKLMEQSHSLKQENEGKRLQDIRDERNQIEMQLTRVNRDIDQTYEDVYEVEEKMERLTEIHMKKRDETQEGLACLRNKCTDIDAKKRRIIAVTNNNTIDLSEQYVSPAAFRQLQVEMEDLKHRNVQVERHVQMQLEERDFLRQSAAAIMTKVYDLEMKVRKETGDHGYHSLSTAEPNWHQDLGAPSVWCTSGALTLDQIKQLREVQDRKYGTARAIESFSSANEDLVMINLTSSVIE